MIKYFYNKKLNNLYVRIIIPYEFGYSSLHKLEHRLFLDKGLIKLENSGIYHFGTTIGNAIDIKICIAKSRLNELFNCIDNILSNKLPDWTYAEKERYNKELLLSFNEDLFDKSKDIWFKEFYNLNNIKKSKIKEDKIWEKIDKTKIRVSVIGDLIEKNNFNSDLYIKDYLYPHIIKNKKKINSVSLFFVLDNSTDYAYKFLFYYLLNKFLNEIYLETGKIYDFEEYSWFYDGFELRGIYIKDIKEKIDFNTIFNLKISNLEFDKYKKDLLFIYNSNIDLMEIKKNFIIGLSLEDEKEMIINLDYNKFLYNFSIYLNKLSIIYL